MTLIPQSNNNIPQSEKKEDKTIDQSNFNKAGSKNYTAYTLK